MSHDCDISTVGISFSKSDFQLQESPIPVPHKKFQLVKKIWNVGKIIEGFHFLFLLRFHGNDKEAFCCCTSFLTPAPAAAAAAEEEE